MINHTLRGRGHIGQRARDRRIARMHGLTVEAYLQRLADGWAYCSACKQWALVAGGYRTEWGGVFKCGRHKQGKVKVQL